MPKTYRTQQGDTWDIIAKRQLGSENLMPALMEANLAQRRIAIFPEGVILNVPDLPEQTKTEVKLNLPPWKR